MGKTFFGQGADTARQTETERLARDCRDAGGASPERQREKMAVIRSETEHLPSV